MPLKRRPQKNSRDEEDRDADAAATQRQSAAATEHRRTLTQHESTLARDSDDDSWEDDDDDDVDEPFDAAVHEEYVHEDDDDDDDDDADEEYQKIRAEKRQVKFTTEGNADAEAADDDDADADPRSVGSVWRRDRGERLDEGEQLDYANRAYDCFFQMRSEFPCLSFDVLRDNEGSSRTKYPLALSIVVGSQATEAKLNQLYVIRVRNLLRTKHDQDDEDDDDSEEDVFGANDSDSAEDADGDDANEEVNSGEPLISFQTIRHHGAVNRVRSNPLAPSLVASWSETGVVQVFDISVETSIVSQCPTAARDQNVPADHLARKGNPLKFISSTSTSHKTEGYGLGWSSVAANTFASGDLDGRIFIWKPTEGGRWAALAGTPHSEGRFVEEIQWSPTQDSVLIATRARGDVEVWDTRDTLRSKICFKGDPTDVNVASWNKSKQSSHLVATGADSGMVAVWDLRMVSQKKERALPIQTFSFHQGNPITSVEFSEHNESVLCVTSQDGQCSVWDLSVERDADEEREVLGDLFNRNDTTTLPDQLMFQHQGLEHPKEAHFHPQIPGLLITGDFNGLHIFKPRNWRSLMK